MLGIINFILGYVNIKVYGPYTGRFLNLIARRRIHFWHLEYINHYEIVFKLRISDFRKLHPIARRTSCRIKILKKFGIPFFLRKFKGRVALASGIVFFFALAWFCTCFVWVVDINGGDAELQYKVREQLALNGLKPGVYSYGINYSELKNDVLLNFPEIANFTVNVSGMHAKVELHLKTPIPEIIDYSTPSNIISDRDGIITSITVTSGTPEVSPGDTVTKGQLLAGGYMTGRTGKVVEYRATADIYARTWDVREIVMPDTTLKKIYVGKEIHKYSIILGRNRLNLYFGTSNFPPTCDKIIKRVQLTLPFGIKLPLYFEECIAREYASESYILDTSRAEAYLTRNADAYIHLKNTDRITNRTFDCRKNSGRITLLYTAECERKIGVEQMIPKGE
ncbi:MAG: sporulation protein YqfD [Clostridia bacterium]|nr:sporulation protein YqfD [Clostridia bacterium]